MFKRSLSLIALLVALALVAAACGDGDDSSEATDASASETAAEEATTTTEVVEETTTTEAAAEEPAETLLIWADERKIEPLQAVAPAFTEATGVEVQVELVPFGDIREQFQAAGPAGEGPDIFVGAHDWTGELAANGVISSIDIGGISDNFVPVSLNGFNFEGQNYAIPYVTEAVAMYYNADLVAEPPATWDDLVTSCADAAVANCLVLPGGGAATDAYHNYPFVSAFGGFIFAFDESTGFDASQVGLDSDAAIEGATFLETQVADGVVASTDYDTAKNLWLEGEAAYWITGPWELGGTREQTGIPNWDVALIPQIGDAPAQPFVGAQGFFLSAFSENSLLAQSFLLDFLATDETMQALYDADPRGTAWTAVQATLSSDPQVAVFDASAANGIPMPNIPEMGAVWGPLGDNMLLIRNGELAAQDAMTAAAEAVRAAVEG
ncbi:MAG: maltose ABC transporter substrate-binding protein, partial [Actinomycetota bacterium]